MFTLVVIAQHQALLPHVDALAAFLGRRECVDFLMPAIVTFLNDRSGWQLRAALFAHIGSIATEARSVECCTSTRGLPGCQAQAPLCLVQTGFI